MLILFDHGTPFGLGSALAPHAVVTAKSKGLLKAAEAAGFDVLLTTDRRIRYQQNLTGRHIALVVLTGTTKGSRIKLHINRIAKAVEASRDGSYIEVEIPFI